MSCPPTHVAPHKGGSIVACHEHLKAMLFHSARANKHQSVRLVVAGAQVRVVREDVEQLRELTIDPRRDYQSLQSSAMT